MPQKDAEWQGDWPSFNACYCSFAIYPSFLCRHKFGKDFVNISVFFTRVKTSPFSENMYLSFHARYVIPFSLGLTRGSECRKTLPRSARTNHKYRLLASRLDLMRGDDLIIDRFIMFVSHQPTSRFVFVDDLVGLRLVAVVAPAVQDPRSIDEACAFFTRVPQNMGWHFPSIRNTASFRVAQTAQSSFLKGVGNALEPRK